jgi:lycopene cyclase domain-containing protein
LWAVYLLLSGWAPGTYLALILAWALPPIALQFAFGADILWHYRKLVTLTVLPAFLYLSVTDSLAIASGTWTIDPLQTTGLFVAALPIEEAVFFLMTVLLIGFGLTLTLAHLSEQRWRTSVKYWRLPLR